MSFAGILDGMEHTPDTTPPEPATPPPGRRGCASFAIGALLVLVGIPMLVCPGPGMVTIASGLGMMGIGAMRRRQG
jgi:hypothetical protein